MGYLPGLHLPGTEVNAIMDHQYVTAEPEIQSPGDESVHVVLARQQAGGN